MYFTLYLAGLLRVRQGMLHLKGHDTTGELQATMVDK
jgi:hypothetical protein